MAYQRTSGADLETDQRMKSWLGVALGCAVLAWVAGAQWAVGEEASEPAAVARLTSDLTYLASDDLAGRGVGTDGIDKAGQFIAQRFTELGLQTTAFKDSPFQEFTIPGATVLGPQEENTLGFLGAAGPLQSLKLSRDFTPLALGKSGKFSGAVAFAGYGITASEFDYNDYAGIDPAGKVVIVIRKEPQQASADSKFDGTQNSQYAYFTSKELNAALHRVAALLIVNDPATVATALAAMQKQLAEAKEKLVELQNGPQAETPAERERFELRLRTAQQQVEQLQQKIEQTGGDSILEVNDAGSALTKSQVPTFFCTRALVNKLLAARGKSLEELEAAIDRDGRPHCFELEGIECTGQASITTSETAVRNVIAVAPGRGTLADEYVVVGAHYDHVGMGGPGSLAFGTIAVHNGADDNGSGTVALLEVARQLTQSSSENRRSVVFMAFSAEESGLLGSKHYVRNPRWPLEKTVAMINLDMVGRLKNEELTVYGTGTAVEFNSQIDRLNEQYRFKIVKVPQGLGPSDHASFYEAKIPVYHFFTGLHNDYHRPSDDVEKVNVAGMLRISHLVADITREIAEAATRPQLVEVSGSAVPRSQNGARPALGVLLDRDSGSEAVIVGLIEGGAAAKAGLRTGDVIVEIDGVAITSSGQLRRTVARAGAGSTLSIAYRRDNDIKVIDVKLGE